ncbi:MAG: chemotaxis response regulator protein-glutamate methylesterase [Erythrobacter sp. RIFCSPHIGHO2_12_FULL_63_10]|nr:MAG: chemotaxis response regulator protein-glutamate methylesterase [Erythrobacter sp. RIFCSPHIGHO2_12_FULL_63_10]
MIVDDSLTVRTVLSRIISGDPVMHIVATAGSAESALLQLTKNAVDVILLDLEMPGMGGMEALPKILERARDAQVLVVSSLTRDGAEHTLNALSMGAADTMLKPRPGGFDDAYRACLLGKIRALGGYDGTEGDLPQVKVAEPGLTYRASAGKKQPQVLAFGASTGGIHAFNIILRGLPDSFRLPILVTQHLPQSFIPVFARQIEGISGRPAQIACDGAEIRPGEIMVASGMGHMTVKRQGDRAFTMISNEPATSGCMPSVDPMLRSLASAYDGHVLAVILSGMGRDGVLGAEDLAAAGGTIMAQDAASSAVWGMPGAVAKAGIASTVLPPDELIGAILRAVGTR